jgi:hypothetical protein
VKILSAAAVALAALVVTTGCSSAQPAAPTPTPTATYASENQVASVIAEYESDWRETIDSASSCRLGYVTGADPASDYVCKTREETIGITAQLATRDLRKLNVPKSMASLVDGTDDALSAISRNDVKLLCGDDGWGGDDTTCNSALASRYAAYQELEAKLDAWSPYL